jgi:hypothetical protein
MNGAGRRSWFSRSVFPTDARPALYVLAPGGDDPIDGLEWSVAVGGEGQVGSSVAAAYAAGVLVRALGMVGAEEVPVASGRIREALRRTAARPGIDADAGDLCDGFIRQPEEGWHRVVLPDKVGTPTSSSRGVVTKPRAALGASKLLPGDLLDPDVLDWF